MSKSGLFAHFRSKEQLQVAVVEHAQERFLAHGRSPRAPGAARRGTGARAGRPLVRLERADPPAGGCFFVTATAELDDEPGPARDLLVDGQRDWLDLIANVFRTGIAEGEFRRRRRPGAVRARRVRRDARLPPRPTAAPRPARRRARAPVRSTRCSTPPAT